MLGKRAWSFLASASFAFQNVSLIQLWGAIQSLVDQEEHLMDSPPLHMGWKWQKIGQLIDAVGPRPGDFNR